MLQLLKPAWSAGFSEIIVFICMLFCGYTEFGIDPPELHYPSAQEFQQIRVLQGLEGADGGSEVGLYGGG